MREPLFISWARARPQSFSKIERERLIKRSRSRWRKGLPGVRNHDRSQKSGSQTEQKTKEISDQTWQRATDSETKKMIRSYARPSLPGKFERKGKRSRPYYTRVNWDILSGPIICSLCSISVSAPILSWDGNGKTESAIRVRVRGWRQEEINQIRGFVFH